MIQIHLDTEAWRVAEANAGTREQGSELAYVKIKAPNQGMFASGIQAVCSVIASGTIGLSRATRIVKFWIPGNKFTKNRIIQYENGGTQVKFFDYHFCIYAYSNFSTVDAPPIVYNIARLNDCFIKMHYKDA